MRAALTRGLFVVVTSGLGAAGCAAPTPGWFVEQSDDDLCGAAAAAGLCRAANLAASEEEIALELPSDRLPTLEDLRLLLERRGVQVDSRTIELLDSNAGALLTPADAGWSLASLVQHNGFVLAAVLPPASWRRHFVVLTDVTADGELEVVDPAKRCYRLDPETLGRWALRASRGQCIVVLQLFRPGT